MQSLLRLLGLFALVSLGGTAESGREVCTDGSVWYDNCNRCWCVRGAAACTLRACISPPQTAAPQCEDGSRWMKDNCNWCSCINGAAVCTKRACLPRWATAASGRAISAVAAPDTEAAAPDTEAAAPDTEAAAPDTEAAAPTPSGSECEATGGRWRVGCNWCRCSEAGKGLCTRRLCSPAVIRRLEDTPVCEEGARWKDECNWCSCADGRAVCTEIACVAQPLPDDEAPAVSTRSGAPAAGSTEDQVACQAASPADRWRQDCNWCRCLRGFSACTKRGCPPHLRARLEGTPQCEGTARWKQGCNWCSCSGGAAVCTQRACIDRDDYPQEQEEQDGPAVYEPDCVGTSRWTEGCNDCQCVDGVKICTLRGCLTEIEDTCVEDAVWKHDCNWCSCKAGKPACSKRACRPVSPTINETDVAGRTCVEGSSWKNDCNSCRCVNGHGICTLRACLGVVRPAVIPDPSRPQIEERPHRPEGRPAVIPDPHRPQVAERPRTEDRPAVIPDPHQPQIAERPRTEDRPAVIPDPNRPQIAERPRRQDRPAVIPDPWRPQVQPRPRIEASVPKDDRDCIPGSRFSVDGCNWCSCTSTGRAACTLRACFKRMDTVCEEGARWRQGCNWCHCGGGKAVCTQLVCFDDVVSNPVAGIPAVEDATIATSAGDVLCIPGSAWTHDCASCSCDDNRQIHCETASCQDDTEPEDTCSEGAEWKQDCGVCRCGRDGRPLCTSSECPDSETRDTASALGPAGSGRQCRPGSEFKEGCNQCRCSSTGVKLCTKRRCRPGYSAPPGPECSEGSVFLDPSNCNWCYCDGGKTSCAVSDSCAADSAEPQEAAPRAALARPALARQAAGDEEACEEGTSWMQECNRCRCISGVGTCDRRACIPFTSDHPDTTFLASASYSPRSRCFKPVDSGPCFASFMRFRYNLDNNRCDGFLYGGCAGNDNNFITAQDCQNTCGGDAPVLDATCERRECPNHREVANMAVRGCTPEYKDASCCHTSYTCSEPPPTSNAEGCIHNATTYAIGDNVRVSNPCTRCRCSSGWNGPALRCTSVECPSLFRRPDPRCRRLYKLDECCAYDEECEQEAPAEEAEVAEARPTRAACESEGRNYLEGDKMFFDYSPCQRCVCGANFTGPYGEGCAPVDCSYDTRIVDSILRGCVPVYFKSKCCAVSNICPGSRDFAADQSQANPDGATEGVCTFGDITVAPGNQLATTDPITKCTCTTPPTLTCIKIPL